VPLDTLDFDPGLVAEKLQPLTGQPLVLGLSGGGDSLALLLIAAEWARRSNTSLAPVIIDHGLRANSADNAQFAADQAEQSGFPARIVRWTGEKPQTGIQAAARQFRLHTFAKIAAQLGAPAVLLGHTQDDQVETLWMRLQAGGDSDSLSVMAEYSPLPLWPEGRGVSLMRPLLDVRRAQLRQWLVSQHQTWLDDPSNENAAFTRVRNRRTLTRLEDEGFEIDRLADLARALRQERTQKQSRAAQIFLESVTFEPWGGACLQQRHILSASVDIAEFVLDAARAAVSGDPTPRRDGAQRLRVALETQSAATVAGIALTKHRNKWYLARDPGAVTGRADNPAQQNLRKCVADNLIWDGRLAVRDAGADITLLGKAYPADLASRDLDHVPAIARPGLPLLHDAQGSFSIPGLTIGSGENGRWMADELVCRNLFGDQPPAGFRTQLREQTAQGSH
jgi:tRNA(Ile)-lysidine synthase